MNKNDFINSILPGAIEAYKKHVILPSLTLAQAALESGWGTSAPGYMLFGIKWAPGCGYDSQLLWTTEYYDGKMTHVQVMFRKYNSYAESIEDHAQLLLKPRYAKVLAAKDFKEACNEIYKAGYATDPEYPVKLIGLIEGYGLNKWDGAEGKEVLESNTIILQKKNGTVCALNGKIYQGSTLAPVRVLAEALGCRVDYDPITKNVKIIEGGKQDEGTN
jgi:flagellum-specific peptidoglycan hydrolase FlgJ